MLKGYRIYTIEDALHEAEHVFAATALGLPVAYVQLGDRPHFYFVKPPSLKQRLDHARILMAGAETELIDKMEASSVNRTRTGLRAALELAATLDHRITNRHVFRLGLRGLPGSNKARRIVLADADVLRIVNAAYEVDQAFGLLVDVLAVTGARMSQAARLTCGDLQADRPDPRIMMPTSFKGRGQKRITHRPVPITLALAMALKRAKGNRPDCEPLLLKRNGTAWQATSTVDHRDLFSRAVQQVELNVPKFDSQHDFSAEPLTSTTLADLFTP